jgi:hypothetical protein
MTPELGRLERVDDVRIVWSNEAAHFTPWLAEEWNLKLIGEAIGIDLELEAQEKSVGPFSADILCKDTATGDWVLIENQLERTDHKHLGQLITYASGLKAVTIVWIANPFQEDHRSALDWLNEITDDKFKFFGLEVELWKIGDSNIAPKFNVVSQPNNWSKNVSAGVARVEREGLTDTKQLQLEFWTYFREYVQTRKTVVRTTNPRPQHWMNMSIGRSGFNLTAIASFWNAETGSYESNEIRAQVEIMNKDAKKYFELLQTQQPEIESELGYSLEWFNDPTKVSCRITARKTVDLRTRSDWENHSAWLLKHLEDLHRVLSPRIRGLSI